MNAPTPLEAITGLASGQVQLAGLALVRIASMISLLPVLGSQSLPRQAKVGLAFALLLCVFPTLPQNTAAMPGTVWGFGGLVLREVCVGLIAGWAFAMVFQVMEFAGAVIDMQAGYSMIELFDPNTGQSTHLFGQFLSIAATVSFLAGGGHAHLIASLARSFQEIPLAAAQLDVDLLAPQATALVVRSILLGLQLCGPVLMALLMLTLVMAVISRIMPSMNAWLVVLPLQILTASAVTALSLPFMLRVFRGWQEDVFVATSAILTGMR